MKKVGSFLMVLIAYLFLYITATYYLVKNALHNFTKWAVVFEDEDTALRKAARVYAGIQLLLCVALVIALLCKDYFEPGLSFSFSFMLLINIQKTKCAALCVYATVEIVQTFRDDWKEYGRENCLKWTSYHLSIGEFWVFYALIRSASRLFQKQKTQTETMPAHA